jgi:fumarate reductase subunit D
VDYNAFYSIIGSNVLTSFSIIIVFIIYFHQRRSDKQEEIENDIDNLINSIDKFNEIVDDVSFEKGLPPTTDLEVIKKYYEGLDNGDYSIFLVELNKLQFQIHREFIKLAGKYEKADAYDDNYKYKIDIINFESWMKDIFPFLNDIEIAQISMYTIIADNKECWHHRHKWKNKEQLYFKRFYEEYWDTLMDIRKNTIKVDKKLRIYRQIWYNSIFDSSNSKICIKVSIIFILVFGLLVPIYMIQPHHLKLLYCSDVYFAAILSLSISLLLIYMAYLTRNKYEMHQIKRQKTPTSWLGEK